MPAKNIKHSAITLPISFETCSFSLHNLYLSFAKLALFKWKKICLLLCNVSRNLDKVE